MWKLIHFVFLVIVAVDSSLALPGSPKVRTIQSLRPRRQQHAKRVGTCASGAQLSVKAPKKNIFAGLSDQEAADATAFLHSQKTLNLTASANATA